MKEKIALYFDGPNHSIASKRSHVNLDYRAFLKGLREQYDIYEAKYYSAYSEEPEHVGVREFLKSIEARGYKLVTKPIHKFGNGRFKGNMDIELALDMYKAALAGVNKIMLFSGDMDFVHVVEEVQKLGVHVTVCSHRHFAANALQAVANDFYELEFLANVEKRGKA